MRPALETFVCFLEVVLVPDSDPASLWGVPYEVEFSTNTF